MRYLPDDEMPHDNCNLEGLKQNQLGIVARQDIPPHRSFDSLLEAQPSQLNRLFCATQEQAREQGL